MHLCTHTVHAYVCMYMALYIICAGATNYWVLPTEHAVRLHVSGPSALSTLNGVGDDGLLGLLDGIVVAPPVRRGGGHL